MATNKHIFTKYENNIRFCEPTNLCVIFKDLTSSCTSVYRTMCVIDLGVTKYNFK